MELYQEGSFFFYTDGGKVTDMLLTGYNLDAEMQELENRGLKSVWLNRYFCGDRIRDLSFLKNYPIIAKLAIVDDDFDCNVISSLKQLSYLQIDTKVPIDFTPLENLNTLITNSTGTKGLPTSIQNLYLEDIHFQEGCLGEFHLPQRLKYLELNRTNLTCLSGLPSGLCHLGIYYDRKLLSLKGLESTMNSLEELELGNCPNITDYSNLRYCSHLKKLILIKCGNIPSLSLLNNSKGLAHLTLSGTLVADKNLKFAETIPYTYITNQKYYEESGSGS